MIVTLYDTKANPPPHSHIDELLPKYHTGVPELLAEQTRHQHEVSSDPTHRMRFACAACDWTDPGVRKLRALKLTRLNRFLRTGKFPPGWLETPKLEGTIRFLSEEEARKTVFPRMFTAPGLRPSRYDKITVCVAQRYLEAMGFTVKPKHAKYGEPKHASCGCVIHADSETFVAPRVEPCERHKLAFEGRDE